jgi:ribonuclease HII
MSVLKSFHKYPEFEAGCDEAGRGCLAGPVFAAAVILPPYFYHPLLNDSKQINARNREILREYIEKNALDYAVSFLEPEVIDQINILNASIKAMHLALDQLKCRPSHIIIDGNRFKSYGNITFDCIIKGDAKYCSIAAASILAKTYRDEYMLKIAEEHPEYGWQSNAGYPTREHRNAIRRHGVTPYHRKSFRLLPELTVQGT